jgi:hypothetical protein
LGRRGSGKSNGEKTFSVFVKIRPEIDLPDEPVGRIVARTLNLSAYSTMPIKANWVPLLKAPVRLVIVG